MQHVKAAHCTFGRNPFCDGGFYAALAKEI
jgi:hypothetical protein